MHTPAHAVGQDPDVAAAAEAALDEHWALRSLGPARRAQILAAAMARSAPAADRDVESAAAAADSALRDRRRRAALRARSTPSADPVSDADTLHLAGAYDLAGRDALAALQALRPDDPAASDVAAAASAEGWALEAQATVAAARTFALLAALALEPAAGSDPDAPASDADAAVLHRLLHLAALAEVGGCRGEWLRWLDRHAAALARRLPAPASAGIASDDVAWDARLRALVVGAWIEVLRRSGPSGLDDATALLAGAREARDAREVAWLREIAVMEGELAAVRARFRLFALAHVGDAAVETLLYLRHGARHASAEAANRAVRRRLQLAREAGAGDVPLDGVLTWLREAARRVVARGSPQLEIAVGD